MANRPIISIAVVYYFALCYQLRRAFFFINQSLVGRSACMKTLRRNLWNNVFTHNIGLYDDYLWNRMEDFYTLILAGPLSSSQNSVSSGSVPGILFPVSLRETEYSLAETQRRRDRDAEFSYS